MSFLSRLLSLDPRHPKTPRGIDELRPSIGQTIHDALCAAGLYLKAPLSDSRRGESPAQPCFADTVLRPRAERTPQIPLSPGSFQEHSFAHATGECRYKLYIPSRRPAGLVPLLVMLHGCTQSPDDFAAGTRMNELAEKHGFLVVYPAQSTRANGSKCWNWFRPQDQGRDDGEPALLTALTRNIVVQHRGDPNRVYVAGLSAGAAMAVILGTTHPDVFAAVGSHSGLPYRAAHDVASAFAAMNCTATQPAFRTRLQAVSPGTPLIVFHGDNDRTVAPGNADALVTQAITAREKGATRMHVFEGSAHGRRYARTVYTRSGEPLVEYWTIHGAGHAWSGGSSNGSYTDTLGPDASAEMVRFFMDVQRRIPPAVG